MFFTITVTTYNRSALLCRCLDSINRQTFKDFEVLILDDCSTDNTQEVVQEYLKDERFKYIRFEKNLGFGDKVFKKTQDMGLLAGEWIGLLSDDEYFYNEFHLEKIQEVIAKNPIGNFVAVDCGFGYSGIEIFSNNSEKLPVSFVYNDLTLEQKKVLDEKIKVFYKKDFLLKYDIFNAEKYKRNAYYEVPYHDLYQKANLLYVSDIAHIFGVIPNARRKYLDFYNWIVSTGVVAFDCKDKVMAYEILKGYYCDTSICLNAFFKWGGEELAGALSYFVLDNDFSKYLEEFAKIYKDKFQDKLYQYYDSFNAMLMSEKERNEALQNAKNIVIYGENSWREQVEQFLIKQGKNILFIADDGRSGYKNYQDIIKQKNDIDLVFISSGSPKVIWQMFLKLQPADNHLKVATLIARDEGWSR